MNLCLTTEVRLNMESCAENYEFDTLAGWSHNPKRVASKLLQICYNENVNCNVKVQLDHLP